MQLPEKYPEILADIVRLLADRLRQHLPDAAEVLALDLAEDLRRKFGGGLIYLPKGHDYERHHRNLALWREFNGRNHRELARRYGVTVATVYDVVAAERVRRQASLDLAAAAYQPAE